MRTILVTGSDTAVGKTHAAAALARLLTRDGARVQIVKVVETGRRDAEEGDARGAQRLAGGLAEAFTLASFRTPLAPAASAAVDGAEVSCAALVALVAALPACDWRILEGAGGVATPVDAAANDWIDFAMAVKVDAIVVVVPDRLGAINQGRLAYARAIQAGVACGVWLNETAPVEPDVARSTREGLAAAEVPIWAEQPRDAVEPIDSEKLLNRLAHQTAVATPLPRSAMRDESGAFRLTDFVGSPLKARCRAALAEREGQQLRRELRVTRDDAELLSLADNDYLALAHDRALADAVAEAAKRYGTSASASPLLTGWREVHAQLLARLQAWHGFPSGMLWSSGYAANAAVLSGLPERADLVCADRLIHHSMIAGLLRSGARLQRYEHLRCDRLEQQLARATTAGRQVFVVTESVFSMDGDYPDLRRMAALKRAYGFCWIVDEAHALGWYGPGGAGLVRAAGVEADVDVLIGTFGKTLASGGAYTLFQDPTLRDHVVNTAGEFIYSTGLPPTTVAAAHAAIERVVALSSDQPRWHALSRALRQRLRNDGWNAPDGESPIVPILLQDATEALALARGLHDAGILVAAIRPPTVPVGTSRVRLSLKRTLEQADLDRVVDAFAAAKATR